MASLIRIRYLFLRILDPDPSINKQRIEEKYWFLLFCDFFYDFLSMKTDVNVPSKRNKHKNFVKKLIFVGIFKVTDEKGRILSRIRIRIRYSVVRVRGIRTKMSRIHNTGS